MPASSPDSLLARHLVEHARDYRDPLQTLNWPELNTQDWWLPEGALSLYGVAEFESVPEAVRKRLSHYEFLNFIYAGLWLEGIFMERMGAMLKRTRSAVNYANYLHELREEAGHSLMFLRLMDESGLRLPRSWRVHSLLDFVGRHAPVESAVFWLAVTLGEEIPDQLNSQLSRDERVNPLIRQMALLHGMDEARHIAYARKQLASRLENLPSWRKRVLGKMAEILIRHLVRTCYQPDEAIYELAGLSPGSAWRERASRNPARQHFVAQCVSPTLNLLRQHGVNIKGF